MSWLSFRRSFQDAYGGLVYTFRYELSFRIQSVLAILALLLAFYFPLRIYERVVIILMVALVLVLELMNSVVERVVDLFKPRIDNAAKIIKDVMAGAVLLAAIVAIIIGWMIFYPHFKNLFIR